MTNKRIYLAGKIGKKGEVDWRNNLVKGGLNSWEAPDPFYDVNGAMASMSCGEDVLPDRWPVLENAVLDRFDYVGPYFIGCDHGCFHAGGHGSISYYMEGPIHKGGNFTSGREMLKNLCFDAIDRADIVFAWVHTDDAYGTLIEIGYALGKGKTVWVAGPNHLADLWFLYVSADTALIGTHETPLDALTQMTKSEPRTVKPNLPKFDSPIERMFWQEWQSDGGEDALALSYQYNVPGLPYRLDFAMPVQKIAIELDGHEYHSDKQQFTKDRQRQRVLEAIGWRFIRFSGSEIVKDVARCYREATGMIRELMK